MRWCCQKTHAKEPAVFNIESANISCDEVVKLLGIDIDYQLNFDKHIKNICRKASQQLGNDHLTRVVRKKNFWTKQKNITPPPPFKLNGRSLKCTKAYWLFFLSKLNKLTIFHSFILSNLAFLFKSKHYKTGENTGKSFTFYLWGLQ